jgi:hypothetical protein
MANIIKNKTKENPKLLFSTLSDGRKSLYLEYYVGYQKFTDEASGREKIKHNRRKESLNLFLYSNKIGLRLSQSKIERQQRL